MKKTNEIIKLIISKYDENEDGLFEDYLANELFFREQMEKERRALWLRKDKIEKETDKQLSQLKHDGYEIMAKCRHWNISYYPDASGGNDSFYVCNDCGFEDGSRIEMGRRIQKTKPVE